MRGPNHRDLQENGLSIRFCKRGKHGKSLAHERSRPPAGCHDLVHRVLQYIADCVFNSVVQSLTGIILQDAEKDRHAFTEATIFLVTALEMFTYYQTLTYLVDVRNPPE